MSVGTIQKTAPTTVQRPAGAARPAESAPRGDHYTPSQPSDNTGLMNRNTFMAAANGRGPAYAGGDPTLDHNRQVCDPNLSSQPLVAQGGRWDSASILNAQSQLDTAGTDRASQESRCGAASMVGGAVMQGPEATARLAERMGSHAQTPEDAARMNEVRDRVLNGTATHADLSALQDTMYRRYNTNGAEGMDAAEMTAMQRDLAANVQFDPVGNTTTEFGGERAVPEQGKVVEEYGRTMDRIGDLQNGQSFALGVDTGNTGSMNHWVQVGRDPQGNDYVYDPYPAGNQPHISRPDANGGVGPYEEYTEARMGAVAPGHGRVNIIGGGTTTY
ncbi:hypothetical protein ABS71_08215 [bacterium SCN 62-11]|nr:MAG: hypothetical protein ABS71_08215 [bacterium SCN 62-11]